MGAGATPTTGPAAPASLTGGRVGERAVRDQAAGVVPHAQTAGAGPPLPGRLQVRDRRGSLEQMGAYRG